MNSVMYIYAAINIAEEELENMPSFLCTIKTLKMYSFQLDLVFRRSMVLHPSHFPNPQTSQRYC
jgi:hypothetical protein